MIGQNFKSTVETYARFPFWLPVLISVFQFVKNKVGVYLGVIFGTAAQGYNGAVDNDIRHHHHADEDDGNNDDTH